MRASWIVVGVALFAAVLSACISGGHVAGGGQDMGRDQGSDPDGGGGGAGGDGGGGSGGQDLATGPDLLSSCAQDPGGPSMTISGHITADTTLTCDSLYLMTGTVIVDAPATLTIEAGSIIHMALDGNLIIAPGAKIQAVGTRDFPIVFTSAKLPGTRVRAEWGAVALVGKSPGNWGNDGTGKAITQHAPDANDWPGGFPFDAGGGADDDSSGTMSYVRLEYGGAPRIGEDTPTEHEMLGLYGVGSGTTISYIDIREGNFECLFAEGGSFKAHHLLCQHSGNGGFGFTRGNRSKIQFLFDQERLDKAAEGIGIKGPFDANKLEPLTNPTIYNATVCGTNGSPATVKDPYALFMNRMPSGDIPANRKPAGHVYNFIGWGFHAGLAMLRAGKQVQWTELQSSIVYNNFDLAAGVDTNIAYPDGTDPNFPSGNDTDMVAWFNTAGWKNSTMTPGIDNCFDPLVMRGAPTTPLTTNAATPPNDGFFDTTAAYIGAFRDTHDDWATGNWVVWDDK